MATEKEIVSPAEALKQATAAANKETALEAVVDAQAATPPASKPAETTPPVPEKPRWKFVKNFLPNDELKFADGSVFKFRLIQLNDGSGYASNSFEVTSDEKLANNLREAAKNKALGIVEVKI